MTDITHSSADPIPLISRASNALTGRFATSGDKSISHRALMLGALAVGRTTIEGLLEAEDVLATVAALHQLGVRIERHDAVWHVHGLGVGGLLEAPAALDMGNAGTGLRLLMGLVAPHAMATRFEGGPTLARRPLKPLLDVLEPIGVKIEDDHEGGLPLTLRGSTTSLPFHHVMAHPSDQIKSALLLAAAQIPGISTVVEPVSTRDHTEKLLADFGADIAVEHDETGGISIRITGLTPLRPRPIVVPGDPSSAAYALVAGLITPGSDLVVENVLINPTRTGLIDTLLEMGGDIAFVNQRETGGEHVADLRVRSSRLKGVMVDAAHAQAMLDDIPALAMAAAYAYGETSIDGLAELRLQECDRLAATAAGLAANKVNVREGEASLTIGGGEGKVDGGATVECRGDHRIAMSFLSLGLAAKKPVTVDDSRAIAASFPQFVTAMGAIGAKIEPEPEKRKWL